MTGFFYSLGKRVGPQVRKAKWMWQSAAGSKAEADRAEQRVGRDLAREVKRQLPPDEDPHTRQTVNRIGVGLAACVARQSRTFSFETLKDAEPNAFALPGGFVFITRGLVDLCGADDELAFVLAHEMAHIIRGHAMHRIISNSAIATASRAVPAHGLLTGWLHKVGVQLLENAYAQDLESEADTLSVYLMRAAGYDPDCATRLLSRLAELERSENRTDTGGYFSSHPSFDTRVHNIECLPRKQRS